MPPNPTPEDSNPSNAPPRPEPPDTHGGDSEQPLQPPRQSWADSVEAEERRASLTQPRAGDYKITLRRVYEKLVTINSDDTTRPALESAKLLVEGLLSGAEMADAMRPATVPSQHADAYPTLRQSTLTGLSSGRPPQSTYLSIARSNLRPASRRPPEALRTGTAPMTGVRRAPFSAAARDKQTALDRLRRLRPLAPNASCQFFLSPVVEDACRPVPSYFRFREAWEAWAAEIGGRIEMLRSMPSGDYLVQGDDNVIQWMRTHYYPEVNFVDFGSWQPRPRPTDPSPSVVLEGVDLGMSHREIIREIKKNAAILEIPESQLQSATLTFSRFFRKPFVGSGAEPTLNGRLVGPVSIISALRQRQGCFLGTMPIYARAYSRPTNNTTAYQHDNAGTPNEDHRDNRDKRTSTARENEEQDLMATEEREGYEQALPPSVRQKTTADNETRLLSPRRDDPSRREWLQSLALPPPNLLASAPPATGKETPEETIEETPDTAGLRAQDTLPDSENPFEALSAEIQQGLDDLSDLQRRQAATPSLTPRDVRSKEPPPSGPRRSERLRRQRERQEQDKQQQ